MRLEDNYMQDTIFYSLKTGEPITLQESIIECENVIKEHTKAQANVKPTDEKVILEWTSKYTGYRGRGSPMSINYLRAFACRPDLVVGSTYSDDDCDYMVVAHIP